MCTVSFIGRKSGYALAMNRDEKLSRVAGLPPVKKNISGRTVVSPSEPGGGTWIAINDSGVAFAIINWYSIRSQVGLGSVSRGEVVKAVCSLGSADSASVALESLPLKKINPFRLIGVFPATQEVIQWQWNLKKFISKTHGWHAQQWVSSGFNEPAAQRVRGETFRRALKLKSAGSLDWLRRLHRSHAPQAGPFSTCMHRDDAATVSYTEVTLSRSEGILHHHAGAPCQCHGNYHRWMKGHQLPTIGTPSC